MEPCSEPAPLAVVRRDDLELLLKVCACYAPFPPADDIRATTGRALAALRPEPAGHSLTCEHCKSAPATCLVVADLESRRITRLVCAACAERDRTDAALIAKATSAVWVFALIPLEA